MFENFGLVDLGNRAGWDITAEAVVWRRKKRGFVPCNLEFAIARRVAGAPECLEMWQLKWGTVIFPADETPVVALMRCMKRDLGMSVSPACCVPVGTVGPWLYRSTIALHNRRLVLTVVDDQAEKETPFYASLFHVDVTDLVQGQVSPAVADFEWVGFNDLIARHGASTNCIYWQMFFMVIEYLMDIDFSENFFKRQWKPGEYSLSFDKSLEESETDKELYGYWD